MKDKSVTIHVVDSEQINPVEPAVQHIQMLDLIGWSTTGIQTGLHSEGWKSTQLVLVSEENSDWQVFS